MPTLNEPALNMDSNSIDGYSFTTQANNKFCMVKNGKEICLPKALAASEEEVIKQLADGINSLINKLSSFFGIENVNPYSFGNNISGEVRVYRASKQYEEVEALEILRFDANGSETRWHKAFLTPLIARMYYTRNFFQVAPSDEFRDVMELLIGIPKSISGITPQILEAHIDNMTDAIDKLFIQQGLQATGQNRFNLLSLIFHLSKEVREDEKVKRLLGTETSVHNLTNPNLIKAASLGQNDETVRLFYILDEQ